MKGKKGDVHRRMKPTRLVSFISHAAVFSRFIFLRVTEAMIWHDSSGVEWLPDFTFFF